MEEHEGEESHEHETAFVHGGDLGGVAHLERAEENFARVRRCLAEALQTLPAVLASEG